jgi:hypothetical protein
MHCSKSFQALIRTLSAELLLCRIVAVLLVVQSSVALLAPLMITTSIDGKLVVLCILLPSTSGRSTDSGVPLDAPQATSCPALMLGNAFASVLPTLPQQAFLPTADSAIAPVARSNALQQLTVDGAQIRAPPFRSRSITHA